MFLWCSVSVRVLCRLDYNIIDLEMTTKSVTFALALLIANIFDWEKRKAKFKKYKDREHDLVADIWKWCAGSLKDDDDIAHTEIETTRSVYTRNGHKAIKSKFLIILKAWHQKCSYCIYRVIINWRKIYISF